MSLRTPFALLLTLACALAASAADYAWIEGENPTRANRTIEGAGWGKAEYLSEGQWAHVNIDPDKVADEVPEGGIVLEYDLDVPSAGAYEVWNRIGFEFVRSPFDWRIDNGAWATIQPDDLTTDLMELDVWCEVAWIKMGEADLQAGTHTLAIRLTQTLKEENGQQVPRNINYASDALCLHKGPFLPNSKHKPDADWWTAEDRAAAEKVFDLAAADQAAPERVELPLSGLWQVCRYDEQEVIDRAGPTISLPDADTAHWMAIQVPGNKFDVRPELGFCHRMVYRTQIDVPDGMDGQSFYMRFPSLNMIGTLYVNGEMCGWTKAMYALWECDITGAVRPGETNEIALVIKDAYYAFSEKKSGQSCRRSFNIPTSWIGPQNFVHQNFDFPVGSDYGSMAGILEEPSLVVAGPVYASDVFAKPSVERSELALDIELRNPGAEPVTFEVSNEIVPVEGGPAALEFPGEQITLAEGATERVLLAQPWTDAKLWWPDEPNLYDAITRIAVDGREVDVLHTRFGFREWQWDGPQFRLNGVPWQLWADTTHGDGGSDADEALAFWRKSGQNMWRFWGRQFAGMDKERALDYMDAKGVIVRRSGIFDGQGANYLHGLADNRELYDNWTEQLRAMVREERNHPSILIWSLENEITFINSRNLGMADRVEPEITRAAQAVMAEDPTRPVMVDGGNCLMDNSLPVNGVHYMESYWRDYPDEAYTLDKAYRSHLEATLPVWGKAIWQLVPDRPIFMGESYYLRGNRPADFAQFAGEGCFSGWGDATRRGGGLLAKMLAEGYRWHGVAAQHFWLGSSDAANIHHNSWQPVCVLCREWNFTFGSGAAIERTLKAFNDTRHADPITVAWALTVDGADVDSGERVFELGPGEHQEFTVSLTMPEVTERAAGEFVLTCARGGEEVFREVKQVTVIDPDGGPEPDVQAGEVVVLDPQGAVRRRLEARGVPFAAVDSVGAIPAGASVVIVGVDALTPREATDPIWMSLAGDGARILVLDQSNPLHYLALPADLTPTDYVGRIAFEENMAHPIFDGLDQPDFFTWSGDHTVYRNVYAKATYGAVSLAHCDERLGYSAIAECPVNDGLLMLCQIMVGSKLDTDPVAQRLFDNMLSYCAAYTPIRRTTAVVMEDADGPAGQLLAESGLEYDALGDLAQAVEAADHDIIVFDATPGHLQTLAAMPDELAAFTEGGGWLMAWGLTEDGLASFNALVGVEHVLRPFELERVTIGTPRDPLLSGLTERDIAMESGEQIFPWAGGNYMVDDEFEAVVDLTDVAPFCDIENAVAGDGAAARAAEANWPRNMVNGFTSADAWKLIHYFPTDNPRRTLELPRTEEVTGLGIVLNTHYAIPTRVNLYFDDDPTPVVLETQPNDERQDFELEPRTASRLTIELAAFDKIATVTGIDNLWLTVARSDEWRERVAPLLNIGGLVKYPMGEGGVILNQLLINPNEPVSANAQKKRAIVSALLRNLHATYAGGRVLTATDLTYEPVPFDEQCNQYITQDRGWFEGGRDLSHLPDGRTRFCGVDYEIRDFKTSPVPSCMMLQGPGARGQLPGQITGIQVGKRADALFFLHTLNRVGEWRRGNNDEAPPVLFQYIVHYADGETAEIPVVYGEGVGHWIGQEPAGLKSAALAWAARFPGDASDDQAVLYQLQWNNERPDVEISTIDIVYGPSGSQYGTPALLALTAGIATE